MDESFLYDLRRMLQDASLGVERSIVSWGPRGLTFIIREPALFATYIAPKYFNIFSQSTFRLVSKSWGFVVEIDNEHGYEMYHHPNFVRDDPSKCRHRSMQEMNEVAQEANLSSNSKLKDALLLISENTSPPPPTQEYKPSSPSISLASRYDKTKKIFNSRKSISSEKAAIKRSSALKGSYGTVPRRGSNGLSITSRRGSLTSGASLTVTPRRSSLNNALTGHVAPSWQASPSTSATVAMLKAHRRHSLHTMTLGQADSAAIAPFARMHMGSAPASSVTPLAVAATQQIDLNYNTLQTKQLAKVIEKEKAEKKKTGMSSDLSFLMYNGAVISGSGKLFTDDLRNILERAEAEGFSHVISWMPHGRSFRVYNERDFSKTILPRFTNKTAFSSFQGALERFGFVKLSIGREKGCFFHPLFIKELPILYQGKNSMEMKAVGWKGTSIPGFFL
jgi:hypothetical protein